MRNIITYMYIFLVLVFGILLVPQRTYWGQENSRTIDSVAFAPIWKQLAPGDINGFNRIYYIDMPRLIVIIIVLTIIYVVLITQIYSNKSK